MFDRVLTPLTRATINIFSLPESFSRRGVPYWTPNNRQISNVVTEEVEVKANNTKKRYKKVYK